MNTILRISRYFIVLSVIGCLVMFGAVTIFAAVAGGNAIIDIGRRGFSLDEIATVIVYAFKVLDLFLIGTILYIVALGLSALFLDSRAALPKWLEVHEFQDLKDVLAQSVVVVMLIAFLGDLLEWEKGSDIVFVGGGVAMVIGALAFILRRTRHSGSPEV